MKKAIITSLSLCILVVVGYKAYPLFMPRIKVENLSGQALRSVDITLPNSNISFSEMSQGSIHITNHSLDQKEGTYKYLVLFQSGAKLIGECGKVTENEFGKIFLLTIRSENEVTCNS